MTRGAPGRGGGPKHGKGRGPGFRPPGSKGPGVKAGQGGKVQKKPPSVKNQMRGLNRLIAKVCVWPHRCTICACPRAPSPSLP